MNSWMKKASSMSMVAALALPLTLGACAEDPNRQGEAIGEVAGSIIGVMLGSKMGGGKGNTMATAAGAVIGMYMGRALGRKLDEADQQMAEAAQQEALEAPIEETITWSNPDNGNSGTITPVRDGKSDRTGEYCREFETTITVDGQLERAYGTACQQDDGSWRIVQ